MNFISADSIPEEAIKFSTEVDWEGDITIRVTAPSGLTSALLYIDHLTGEIHTLYLPPNLAKELMSLGFELNSAKMAKVCG